MTTKVLIVEDDEDTASCLGFVLGRYGIESDMALDGVRAIELMRANKYDVLVSDVCMPKMSGMELVAFKPPGLRSIAMSGHSEPEWSKDAFAAGFDAYLVKPVEIEKLVGTIHSLIAMGDRPDRT